jgi:hypothetical protein
VRSRQTLIALAFVATVLAVLSAAYGGIARSLQSSTGEALSICFIALATVYVGLAALFAVKAYDTARLPVFSENRMVILVAAVGYLTTLPVIIYLDPLNDPLVIGAWIIFAPFVPAYIYWRQRRASAPEYYPIEEEGSEEGFEDGGESDQR